MGYAAFISYSHAEDRRLAAALQAALHRFAKPWYRLRALRVFRDDTNLAPSADLSGVLAAALDAAAHLVLFASPGAAASAWVGAETRHWLERKPASRILIVLTQGDIAWDAAAGDFDWVRTDALPRTLAGAFAGEPLHLDLRWAREAPALTLRDPRFLDAVARLSAALRGVSLDAIAGEEVRQHRRTRRIAMAAAASIAVLLAAACTAGLIAYDRSMAARRALQSALAATDAIVVDIAAELKGLSGVSTERIERILGRAEQVLDRLARIEQTEDVRQSQASLLNAMAGIDMTIGNLARAQARAAAAEALLAGLLRGAPETPRWLFELSVAQERQGDVAFERRDFAGARRLYARAAALREGLHRRAPDDAVLARRLAQAYHDSADATDRDGATAAALALHRQGLAISEAVARTARGAALADAQFELANSHARLCRLGVRLKSAEAEAACRANLALLESLAGRGDARTPWRHELSRSQATLARLLAAAGRGEEALAALDRALATNAALAAADPRNTEFVRDRALFLARQARLQRAAGAPERALAALGDSAALWLRLLTIDEANLIWLEDAAYDALDRGELLATLGREADSQGALRLALERFRSLAARAPAPATDDAIRKIEARLAPAAVPTR